MKVNGKSCAVQDTEVTYNNGRYTVSLSQMNFNGQSTVTIPISNLVSTVYLRLSLPADTGPGAGASFALPHGWGYYAIQNISYLLGSSNCSQLQINGQSLLQMNLAECETAEKRTEILTLGGAPYAVPASTAIVQQDAYLILNFPWSRVAADLKLPLDTTLMSNSITLNIQFQPATYFMSGSYAPTYAAAHSSFNNAQLMLRQGEMRDKALSLRDKLMVNKSLSYNYPFLHYQSFSPPQFVNTTGTLNQLVLQSFINADLVSIVMHLVRVPDLQGGNAAASIPNVANPGLLYDMRDLQLLFNGQTDVNSPGYSYKLYDLHNQEGADYNGYFPLTGTAAATTITNEQAEYRLRVDYGMRKNLSFDSHYQNVRRIANQTLTLQFYIDQPSPNVLGGTAITSVNGATFQLFCTYVYNGVASITDGQSKVYFD